jgi:hypothetical protein
LAVRAIPAKITAGALDLLEDAISISAATAILKEAQFPVAVIKGRLDVVGNVSERLIACQDVLHNAYLESSCDLSVLALLDSVFSG